MKYMGNKSRFADELLSIMNVTNEDVFVDLFCGSLAVSQRANAKAIIANDNNKYLVAMFNGLLKGIDYPDRITRELYNNVRDYYNKIKKQRMVDGEFDDGFIGWCGFMGSRNGRFFDGGYSGNNVKGRNYIDESINNIYSQLNELKKKRNIITLSCKDYQDVDCPENAIVYCDIPYKGTTPYSESKNFDYYRFYNYAIETSKHCRVYISEYSMPERYFKCIYEKKVTNSLSLKNTYKRTEKLFIVRT